MLDCAREELLFHPLTRELVRMKWSVQSCVYLFTLASFSLHNCIPQSRAATLLRFQALTLPLATAREYMRAAPNWISHHRITTIWFEWLHNYWLLLTELNLHSLVFVFSNRKCYKFCLIVRGISKFIRTSISLTYLFRKISTCIGCLKTLLKFNENWI